MNDGNVCGICECFSGLMYPPGPLFHRDIIRLDEFGDGHFAAPPPSDRTTTIYDVRVSLVRPGAGAIVRDYMTYEIGEMGSAVRCVCVRYN